MDLAKDLTKVVLFRELTSEELAELAKLASVSDAGPGTELLCEGQPVNELHVVLFGTVKVTKRDRNGDDEEVATLGTGTYLGEVELARNENTSAATVTTVEPAKVASFPREAIMSLCSANPTFGYHLFRGIAGGLARRLSNTTDLAARYRSKAVRQRG